VDDRTEHEKVTDIDAVERRVPNKSWYFLPLAVLILGSVASGYLLFKTISSFGEDHIPVATSGETRVVLAEKKKFTIFVETKATPSSGSSFSVRLPMGDAVVSKRDVYDTKGLPKLLRSVSVRSPSGKEIPVIAFNGSQTYSIADRHGAAAYTFMSEEAGSYRVTPVLDRGPNDPVISLAISEGGFGYFQGMFLGIFGFYFSFVLALAIWVFVYQRRDVTMTPDGQEAMPPYDRKVMAMLLSIFVFAGIGTILMGRTALGFAQAALGIFSIAICAWFPFGMLLGFPLGIFTIIWGIMTVRAAKTLPPAPTPTNLPPRPRRS
jgi:hypothetical protein